MTKTQYEIDIEAPVEEVYKYYTNPENIKDAWPRDIVKESTSLSSEKNEEGSQMKVKGEYMGRKEEMMLEVVDKKQNRKLITRQIQGPFKHWESIQEFQTKNNGDNDGNITKLM
jgi:ligand-binding SRPBCC domain-containing protein